MRNLCIEERKDVLLDSWVMNGVGDYGGYVGHVNMGLR